MDRGRGAVGKASFMKPVNDTRGYIRGEIAVVILVAAIFLVIAVGQYDAAVARGYGRGKVVITLALIMLMLVGGIGVIVILFKGVGRMLNRLFRNNDRDHTVRRPGYVEQQDEAARLLVREQGKRLIKVIIGVAGSVLVVLGAPYVHRGGILLLIAMALPGAYALVGIVELISGTPFTKLASRWDEMPPWKKNTLFWLIAAVAGVVIFGIAGIVTKDI